jgi:hypothetical protein
MNLPRLNRRVDSLSAKIVDEPREYVARFDNVTFSEAEKTLFQRIEELQEEFGVKLTPEVLKANKDLINKGCEIIYRYGVGTIRFTLLCLIGDPNNGIDKLYFMMHYYQFVENLRHALKEAHTSPEIASENLWRFLEKVEKQRGIVEESVFDGSAVNKKTEYPPTELVCVDVSHFREISKTCQEEG